jgi:hypothetical protein
VLGIEGESWKFRGVLRTAKEFLRSLGVLEIPWSSRDLWEFWRFLGSLEISGSSGDSLILLRSLEIPENPRYSPESTKSPRTLKNPPTNLTNPHPFPQSHAWIASTITGRRTLAALARPRPRHQRQRQRLLPANDAAHDEQPRPTANGFIVPPAASAAPPTSDGTSRHERHATGAGEIRPFDLSREIRLIASSVTESHGESGTKPS